VEGQVKASMIEGTEDVRAKVLGLASTPGPMLRTILRVLRYCALANEASLGSLLHRDTLSTPGALRSAIYTRFCGKMADTMRVNRRIAGREGRERCLRGLSGGSVGRLTTRVRGFLRVEEDESQVCGPDGGLSTK
jgi:hypothetical protein